MAQELAIAKAAFSASLFRADPNSLTRPQVEAFFPLVDAAITQCSRPNVQTCKDWIIHNAASSGARTASLGKYLAALSKSQADSKGSKPSIKRKRLHILYIVSDVAHHVSTRGPEESKRLSTAWALHLPNMIASAAAFDGMSKHKKKLEALLDLWEDKSYFSRELISSLRKALTNGTQSSTVSTSAESNIMSQKSAKEAPYVLPSLHGDPSAPWYDLPATTLLPHMRPNSFKPMVPDHIRPIKMNSGPADKTLASAVQNLLSNVDRMYSKEKQPKDEPHEDISKLGERILLDEITGEIIGGDTYYGWSRPFCEKMKERKKKAKNGETREQDRESRSRSRSRSMSRSPRPSHSRASSRSSRGRSQRRQRSTSGGPAFKRARQHSRSRSRSWSPRRSQTPTRGFNQGGRRSRDSRSRSRSRSHTSGRGHSHRHHGRPYSRTQSRSRSGSREYDQKQDLGHHQRQQQLPPPSAPQSFPPPHQGHPPFPGHHPHFPPPPGEFPPPPPPTGYAGQWPPPPPPPPPQMSGSPPQNWFPGGMPPNVIGAPWGQGHPPPPPPPPPQQYHHNNSGGAQHYQGSNYQGGAYEGGSYGRGNSGYRGRGRGRGRGGFDRGRGWS